MDDYDIFEGMLNELELLPKRSVALIADEVLDDNWFLRVDLNAKLYEDIAVEMVNRYVDSGACEEWSANQYAFWFINGILDRNAA
jgi:hypothetical protein